MDFDGLTRPGAESRALRAAGGCVSSGDFDVAARGHDHEVNVAPFIGLPAGVRAEDNSLEHVKGVMPAQHLEGPPRSSHYSRVDD